ncbi:Predicted arabinose efflux permease, MFS family [Anaerovirgula multivorans]|uniref:Predicted arabinose efflux permease, MFS family n=1 Tax=Anaerovirgula multivorans TaxID=312168 RepID=A0A239HIG1_9FIRM|nr:MFS transporter [Anaerovirgula multivorans]SNS80838.1 Predicted arabinose efflux permease, MFS family [Anaerovirgula multivorans]
MNRKTLFCIITGFFWFSLYAYVPQIANYAKEMGASYKMIGLIAGAYGLSQTVLRIPLGVTSDMLNRRKIFITVGSLVTILSALSVFFLPNAYTLLIARFLAGIAAATWVTFTVMFSSYYEDSQSTKAVGILNSVNKAGQFVAMLAGGIISLYIGVRYIFMLSVITGIIAFVLSISIEEEKSPMPRRAFEISDIAIFIKNKEIMYISFLGALSQLITYGTTFGFTPLVASNIGANNLQLGYLTMIFTLPQILFAALSGTVFIKYFGEKKTLLMGFGLNTILSIFIPFVPTLTMLYVVQMINGIGNAISFPLLTGLVIRNVESNLRNTAMGFYQALYGVGMIVGPILLGNIGDRFGLVSGFIVTGLLGIIAIASILLYEVDKQTVEVL